MTYVADDADLQGLIYPEDSFVIPSPLVDPAAGREGFRMMLDLMEAAGYQQTITSCQAVSFGSRTSVVCGFDFNALASDVLGLGPVTGNRFLFTVVGGEIVRAWVDWDTPTVSSQLLKPFRDWVSATHPKDVRVMFGPPSRFAAGYLDPRYTNESIRLWRLRTPEFVESMQTTTPTQTAPPLAHASAAPDVVRQRTCSGDPRSHLELTDMGDRIEARFVLHQMTLPGHRWRMVLKIEQAGMGGPIAGAWRVFFEGTRLARGDSGDITVQRSVLDPGGVFVLGAAKARDRQTGQFCRVLASPQ